MGNRIVVNSCRDPTLDAYWRGHIANFDESLKGSSNILIALPGFLIKKYYKIFFF